MYTHIRSLVTLPPITLAQPTPLGHHRALAELDSVKPQCQVCDEPVGLLDQPKARPWSCHAQHHLADSVARFLLDLQTRGDSGG